MSATHLYWISTALIAAVFLGSGLGNLLHAPHIAEDMLRLGYPDYFMTVLGIWKILGAFTIVAPRLPRLKEWAYAGMIFDLTGAAASRASIGDEALMVIVPLILTGAVMVSWALRPVQRRLLSASTPA